MSVELTHELVHAARKELYQRSFYDFCKAAWRHVDNDPYIDNWHVEALCLHLQAVFEGKINRLLINVPPGTAKSMIANVLFPAWVWTRDLKKRIINTSYAVGQSERDTVKSRRLILSEWYQSYWPVTLQEDQNQKGKYENTQGGAREAKSYSNITGSRANIVIVDDPQSADEANSAAERHTATRIFWTAVQTRLNNPKRDAIIVIMQRLHEEDVAGTILEKNLALLPGTHGRYDHLCIPMEYEGDGNETKIGWRDPRTKPGELMFPQLFPPDVVAATKAALGPFAYAGQFQQTPAPTSDGFLRRDWFHLHGGGTCPATLANGVPCAKHHPLPDREQLNFYMFSDHAPSGRGDFNVFRIWGVDKDRNQWLVDSFREQCTMDEAIGVKTQGGKFVLRDRGALPMIHKWRPLAWFPEGDNTWKSIAPAVRTQMLETGVHCPIYELPTRGGDKMGKAQAYQGMAALGKVYLPAGQVGETALLEYIMFPVGKHDDQVDADSALSRVMNQAHPAFIEVEEANNGLPDYLGGRNGSTAREFDGDTFY